MRACPADLDRDADVDIEDFAVFEGCFNGLNRPPVQSGCTDADFDAHADVDLIDFTTFQACFNGPNRAARCSP